MLDVPADFFDFAPTIRMHDPLARFLGASGTGNIEYRYADAVALAGHSCPTVAAAFLMTRVAVRRLYPDALPERGAIHVSWRDEQSDGVTGVMASVAGLITGAAGEGGFKGISGNFRRSGLLAFGAPIDGDACFSRVDNAVSVVVSVSLDKVPMAPEVMALLAGCLDGTAAPEEHEVFRRLWQDRVRRLLLNHADDSEVIRLHGDNTSAA